MSPAGKPQGPLIALSTASVYPDRAPDAFEMAARLGYDGIEVMVSADAVSQDVDVLRRLADYHGIPVLAVHAPCLLVTQRVWGREPWGKLTRSAAVAEKLGAKVVVVHPPFRWQRDYARDFAAGLERMRDETDVIFAVENMFPLRAGGAEVAPYSPHWNPVPQDYPAVTLDLSHASVSGSDALAMADELGSRLAHVHLADGTGVTTRDEHLVPGRGAQPCAPLLQKLAAEGYTGAIVLEVNTRRATSREARRADLAEALDFTRRYLTPASNRGRVPDGSRGRVPGGTSRHGTDAADPDRQAAGDRARAGDRAAAGDRARAGDRAAAGDRARAGDQAAAGNRATAGDRADGHRGRAGQHDGPDRRAASGGHGTPSRPETDQPDAANGLSAAGRVRGLGRAVSRPAARGSSRDTAERAGAGPVPGAGPGTSQRGSALALRRWRRLDGQAHQDASCRS